MVNIFNGELAKWKENSPFFTIFHHRPPPPLGVKIPNKIAKSYCPNLCPIFGLLVICLIFDGAFFLN